MYSNQYKSENNSLELKNNKLNGDLVESMRMKSYLESESDKIYEVLSRNALHMYDLKRKSKIFFMMKSNWIITRMSKNNNSNVNLIKSDNMNMQIDNTNNNNKIENRLNYLMTVRIYIYI